ncbi:2,5-didehydrogluconate reductase DkgA [Melittangium boletus]|uniref:2,5-didehydrogluconate reductase DkgA n=1 Tax=Melittangium boletus TaxID=83453 RepID=UPI003DA242F7
MSAQPRITFHDGKSMPQLGLGVWQASVDEARRAALKAIEVGYRSIDTAAIYRNEEGIGQAIRESSVPRDQLYITTKLWNDAHLDARKALETSLRKLQLDAVDLYLIHWPTPAKDNYVQAWKSLIELRKAGLTRSIGVSNFHVPHLQRLIDETGVVPVLNQIEVHPLLQQSELRAWNVAHEIHVESWSPLAQGGEGVFDQEIIRALGQKYGKTPAQVVIRWHLDQGLIVIPKSVTPSRIEENFQVFDFRLEPDELARISTLDKGKRLGPNPDRFS